MDFLKAVKQAEQQGIKKEQFLPIWEAELRLQHQKEEVRLLELKLKVSEECKDGDVLPIGIESLIKQQFKQQRKELNQMKSEMLLYQQAMLQVVGDISSLLTSVITPNESSDEGQQQGNRADNAAMSASVLSSVNQAAAALDHLCIHDSIVHQSKLQDVSKQVNPQKPVNLAPRNMPLQSDMFTVEKVSCLVESCGESLSPHLTIPNCPCDFHLSVSFSQSKELVVNIVATRATGSDNSMKWPVSVSGKGFIQNKAKGYSLIWNVPNGTEITLNKKLKETSIKAPICLKTCGGKFESVTLELLESRNFILEDSITFKWGLDVKEATSDNVKEATSDNKES